MTFFRLAPFALILLAACAPKPVVTPPPPVVPGYEQVEDNGFTIPAVDPVLLTATNTRREVDFAGKEKPGSIVVDTHARVLYFVLKDHRAMRYSIAVGREGLSFTGSGVISRKEKWPSWQPTANMLKTQHDTYAKYAAGLPGGLDNPLGARALYLFRNGKDTHFRIHGTIDNHSITRASSAGCIRLFNQDALDLYDRVKLGASVKVRTLEESIAAEGPYMDDAYGRAVPDTPENQAQKVIDTQKIAEAEAAKAEADRLQAEAIANETEGAKKRRLARCERAGIAEGDCPPPKPRKS